MNQIWQVMDIVRGTTVDGPGFRTSIYLAGCNHRCPGCHNPQSWSQEAGHPMTLEEIMKIVREENFDVTLSGGDPLLNPVSTGQLVSVLKEDGRNVWLFTGYSWEEIIADAELRSAIEEADTVVDGSFIEALKDPDLIFRGSTNQRIINVRRSLADNMIHLWHPED